MQHAALSDLHVNRPSSKKAPKTLEVDPALDITQGAILIYIIPDSLSSSKLAKLVKLDGTSPATVHAGRGHRKREGRTETNVYRGFVPVGISLRTTVPHAAYIVTRQPKFLQVNQASEARGGFTCNRSCRQGTQKEIGAHRDEGLPRFRTDWDFTAY